MKGPRIIASRPLGTQVCVDARMADEAVLGFVAERIAAGTKNGWQIAFGDDQRAPCDDRPGCVHLWLYC